MSGNLQNLEWLSKSQYRATGIYPDIEYAKKLWAFRIAYVMSHEHWHYFHGNAPGLNFKYLCKNPVKMLFIVSLFLHPGLTLGNLPFATNILYTTRQNQNVTISIQFYSFGNIGLKIYRDVLWRVAVCNVAMRSCRGHPFVRFEWIYRNSIRSCCFVRTGRRSLRYSLLRRKAGKLL